MMTMHLPVPTAEDLKNAHQMFEKIEPRGLFYRVAIELIDLAHRGETSVTVAEALAVLLQTWNRSFYRFGRIPFDEKHFVDIQNLLDRFESELAGFRTRSIESFTDHDTTTVKEVFRHFEQVLGPVGAAKALHLLAPRFFTLWDRAIAEGYSIKLQAIGRNASLYLRFMDIVKYQCESLGGESILGSELLKRLDEFNYCTFTVIKQK